MNTQSLLLLFLTIGLPYQTLAQQRASEGGTLRSPLPPAQRAADLGGELKRFNLEFPGIVPDEQRETRIMAIKVFGVTVPELFSALESAGSTERPIVISPCQGGGGSKNMQFRNVSMGLPPEHEH